MKRLSILVSVALVALLSTGAFAANLNTDFGGMIGYELRYDQHDGLVSRGLFDTRITVTGESGAVKVDFGVGTNYTPGGQTNFAHRNGWLNFTEHRLFQGDSAALSLKVQRANVTLKGPLFKNGQDVETAVGRFNFNWNPVVASNEAIAGADAGLSGGPLSHATGVQLLGVEAGPLTVDLAHFYLNWGSVNGENTDRPTFVRVKGNLDVVEVTGIVVNHEHSASPGVAEDRVTDFVVTAGLAPADGVKLNATYGSNGENDTSHYKIEGELATIPNLTLTGSFWSTDDGFAPRYGHRNQADRWGTNNRSVREDEAGGYKIGASTTQGGVDLSVSYAAVGKHTDANFSATRTEASAKTTVSDFDLSASYKLDTETGANDTSEITLGAGTDFDAVRVDYEGVLKTGENMKNAIKASTTLDTILADGVNLSGKVTLQQDASDGVDTKFEFDAEWKAPNGIGLGLHYANYSRAQALNKGDTDTLRHNGVPVTEIGPNDTPDGFYVTASYTTTF